jgi:hypothetical protein
MTHSSYGIHEDSKSQYGFRLRIDRTSAVIHTHSSLIKVVTRSALESELSAINDNMNKFVIYLLNYQTELPNSLVPN